MGIKNMRKRVSVAIGGLAIVAMAFLGACDSNNDNATVSTSPKPSVTTSISTVTVTPTTTATTQPTSNCPEGREAKTDDPHYNYDARTGGNGGAPVGDPVIRQAVTDYPALTAYFAEGFLPDKYPSGSVDWHKLVTTQNGDTCFNDKGVEVRAEVLGAIEASKEVHEGVPIPTGLTNTGLDKDGKPVVNDSPGIPYGRKGTVYVYDKGSVYVDWNCLNIPRAGVPKNYTPKSIPPAPPLTPPSSTTFVTTTPPSTPPSTPPTTPPTTTTTTQTTTTQTTTSQTTTPPSTPPTTPPESKDPNVIPGQPGAQGDGGTGLHGGGGAPPVTGSASPPAAGAPPAAYQPPPPPHVASGTDSGSGPSSGSNSGSASGPAAGSGSNAGTGSGSSSGSGPTSTGTVVNPTVTPGGSESPSSGTGSQTSDGSVANSGANCVPGFC
jgi:hypothetical protein